MNIKELEQAKFNFCVTKLGIGYFDRWKQEFKWAQKAEAIEEAFDLCAVEYTSLLQVFSKFVSLGKLDQKPLLDCAVNCLVRTQGLIKEVKTERVKTQLTFAKDFLSKASEENHSDYSVAALAHIEELLADFYKGNYVKAKFILTKWIKEDISTELVLAMNSFLENDQESYFKFKKTKNKKKFLEGKLQEVEEKDELEEAYGEN